MMNLGFWLRWSWRDLKARWLQVVAIALIIALGTGVFAGLGGQETWRVESLDQSYERLNHYDLQVDFADGTYVDEDTLSAALSAIEGLNDAEPRLVAATLVDASTDKEDILVSGRVVGVDVTEGGPYVDEIHIEAGDGRSFTSEDAGQRVVVVEKKFADYYDLQPGDSIRVSGDVSLDYVGTGTFAEYFQIIPEDGTFSGEASLAILFMPLDTLQDLTGHTGLVNDVVITVQDGASRAAVATAVEETLAATFPEVGFEVTMPEDDPVHHILYSDARNDQDTWNLIGALFLIGASFGAFNLAGRMVESQRRQIGIGMALGVPRGWLAFRPLLVGAQIAILGTIMGLVIGWGLSLLFANLFKTLLPLPYWGTSLYLPGYIRAALLGLALPLVATMIPVWRAVRVQPIDAIKSGHLVAKGGGLSWLLNYLPIPGRSFTQMPFRNILRSPWRTLLTVLGIAMAILLMTAFIGFMDSFIATLDQGEEAYLYQGRDRLLVQLDTFYPQGSERVTDIVQMTDQSGERMFGETEPALVLGGKLSQGTESIDTLLELHDMQNPIWVPRLIDGELRGDMPGIVISEKAAEDLGVKVGDSITLEHPLREGEMAFRLVETEIPLVGIHDNPIRGLSYMDMAGAAAMGLGDMTNMVVVTPDNGSDATSIKRALLVQPGVASVQAIGEFADALEEALEIFVAILAIIQGIVLLMAFLIAFNSTSINVDERSREFATMFAFGLPLRTVTRMQVVENLLIGILGTALGVVLGWLALNYLLVQRVEDQLEDFKFIITLSPDTLAISVALGVLVVALTPLLSIRKMSRMDIPSTLRVME
ncbi:MAG: FtsX-like permease family protein [Chloroflexi bacterium]|nr:FtsX-like permease family protein [Chloroflexota bacterium]